MKSSRSVGKRCKIQPRRGQGFDKLRLPEFDLRLSVLVWERFDNEEAMLEHKLITLVRCLRTVALRILAGCTGDFSGPLSVAFAHALD